MSKLRMFLGVVVMAIILLIAGSLITSQTGDIAQREAVQIVPYGYTTPASNLTQEEVAHHMDTLIQVFKGVDLCKAGYMMATVGNIEASAPDLKIYYNELMMKGEADQQPLDAHRNAQTLLNVGVTVCKTSSLLTQMFNALSAEESTQ